MKNFLIGAIATVAFVAGATAAAAHGKLLAAAPAVGAQVAGSPGEIRMTFSEGIFPNFSGVVLKDKVGHVVKTGPSRAEDGKKQLVVPIRSKLAPGTYQVVWHVVCIDTHRMQGQYAFVVK